MIGEDKQDITRQLAAISVETKQKTSYGLCGETGWGTIRSTCKKKTQNNNNKKHKQSQDQQQVHIT